MSAENWHEERDRLVRLLKAIESGEVTHIDEEDMRQLQATTSENVEALKQRLAELNDRIGPAEERGSLGRRLALQALPIFGA